MRINESRQHRRFRKIDDLHACRSASARRHGHDFVALDLDESVLDRLLALPVDQFSSADGDAMWGLRTGKHGEKQTQRHSSKDAAHWKLLPQGGKAYQRWRESSRPFGVPSENGGSQAKRSSATSTTARASANISHVRSKGLHAPHSRATVWVAAIRSLCLREKDSPFEQRCFNLNRIRKSVFREEM